MKIRIVTVSDRAAAGVYEDLTGPAVSEVLAGGIEGAAISTTIVPDEPERLTAALADAEGCDVVLTAGGTGLSVRDVTPEAMLEWGERQVQGIAEYLRLRSLEQTNRAALSRGVAVQKGNTLAVTLPGSVRGAKFCAELLVDLLPHAVSMMAGEGH